MSFSAPPSTPRRRYWTSVKRLTFGLLLAWFLISFVAPWFAQDIDASVGKGAPVSYWMAVHGLLVLFIAVVTGYALRMDRIEARLLEEERIADAEAQIAKAAGSKETDR